MKFRLAEENELQKRAKKHSKKQDGMSPFCDLSGNTLSEGIWAYQTYIDRKPGEKQPSKTLMYGGNFVTSRSPYRKEQFGADWKRHIRKIIDWSTEHNPSLHRMTQDYRLDNFGKNANSEEAYISAIEDGIRRGNYELLAEGLNNTIPSRQSLVSALKTFDKNGKLSTRGDWKVANGGYDLSFEVYYQGTPVAQGFTDGTLTTDFDTSEFGFTKQALANVICSVYTDMTYKSGLQESKKRKKKKGVDSVNPNAGNVEYNNAMFNHMNNATESPSTNPMGPMAEGLDNESDGWTQKNGLDFMWFKNKFVITKRHSLSKGGSTPTYELKYVGWGEKSYGYFPTLDAAKKEAESIMNDTRPSNLLDYDSTIKKLDTEFEVATPQEVADMFNRPVRDGDKIYNPTKREGMNENSNKYRRLKRALFGDDTGKIKTFAIISSQNPFGVQATPQANKVSDDNFKKALKLGNFTYTPLKGHYGNAEKSYIIFNLTLADAKVLAKDYQQESFFYGKTFGKGENSTISYYLTRNQGETYDEIEQSDTITLETDAEDFFSKFGIKYRINMKEFGDEIPEVKNKVHFEESLNEKRTFLSRARHRKDAYR